MSQNNWSRDSFYRRSEQKEQTVLPRKEVMVKDEDHTKPSRTYAQVCSASNMIVQKSIQEETSTRNHKGTTALSNQELTPTRNHKRGLQLCLLKEVCLLIGVVMRGRHVRFLKKRSILAGVITMELQVHLHIGDRGPNPESRAFNSRKQRNFTKKSNRKQGQPQPTALPTKVRWSQEMEVRTPKTYAQVLGTGLSSSTAKRWPMIATVKPE
jgi:hypothetical protein